MDWAHIFTTHEFWTGAIGSGLLTGAITYLSTRASDRRKFKQEDKVRDEESLYNVAMEYTETCSDILMNSVDIKGAFNMIRDMLYNRAGADDPKAEDKVDHASKVTEANMQITVPYNKLRMIAPKNVIGAAIELNTAMIAVLRTTPEPFAQPVTRKTAADALENFINVFRAEVGKEAYTATEAQKHVLGFLDNLKTQVDKYVEESKAEMKAAGFETTPWDNM